MTHSRTFMSSLLAVALAGILAVGLAGESTAQAPRVVFSDVARRIDPNLVTAPQPRPDDLQYLRTRLAIVDVQLLQQSDVGTRLRLNLFDGVDVTAIAVAVDSYRPGSVSWRGRIEGRPLAWARFERVGDAVVGALSIGGRSFALHYAGNGVDSVRELDVSSLTASSLDDDDILVRRSSQPAARRDPPPARAKKTMKYGAVYTKAARNEAGGTDAINAVAQLTVTMLNDAMAAQNVEH